MNVVMQQLAKLYIDGAWVNPASSEVFEVIDSSSEQLIATVPSGTAVDIDRAVRAARRAFDGWASLSGAERGEFLGAISEALESRRDELVDVIAREVGMPVAPTSRIQVGMPIRHFATAGRLAATYEWECVLDEARIYREPVGVVGAITPWNYPLNQIAAKVAFAMAAGCTVVLKPSEVAPINAFILADIIDGLDVPAGVFNLVSGDGAVAGESLVSHPLVDMVSFTGSTRAGRRVAEVASATIKRVALELGGKSPNVILDDADIERAVVDGVTRAYANSGQTCSALSRMIVPRPRLGDVERIAARAVEDLAVGDPFAEGTVLGPLVSAAQRDRVRGFIEAGVAEGATLLTGGTEPPDGLTAGFYVRPTIFSNVDNTMRIAREEIFGPVLSILPCDSEEHAISIANDSDYGLSGAVWSNDPERARRVARRLRTGRVEINGVSTGPDSPFGGYKQSGNGREYGRYGLEEFLEVKATPL